MKTRSGNKFVFFAVIATAAMTLLPVSCASPESGDFTELDDAGAVTPDAKPDVADAKPDKTTGGAGGSSGQAGSAGASTGGKGGSAGTGGKGGSSGKGGGSGTGGVSGTGGSSGSSGTSGSSGSPMYAVPPGDSEQTCAPGKVFIFGACFP